MADKPWKAEERAAAAIFGGARFWANSGERMDFESSAYVGQVKLLKRIPKWLEELAVEVERLGFQKSPPKIGVVVLKRRAGRGTHTPRLIVLTEAAWREMNGSPPTEKT